MSIRVIAGEDFEPAGLAGVEAMVNPTYTRCGPALHRPHGYMLGGWSWLFGQLYPEMAGAYYAFCRNGDKGPGDVHVWENLSRRGHAPRWVINLPIGKDYGDTVTHDTLRLALDALHLAMEEHAIRSIALPALGCGLGGLCWSEDVIPALVGWMSGHGYHERHILVVAASPLYATNRQPRALQAS